jgi:hypothetical protein
MNTIQILHNMYKNQFLLLSVTILRLCFSFCIHVYAVGVPVAYGACCSVCVPWLTASILYVGG